MLADKRLDWSVTVGATALCGLVAAAAVLSFLRHACGVILFPYELAAGEELLLRDAVRILSGRPVYADVNDFPFIVSNYPPLFALISSLLIPVVGVSLTATRVISTLSTLLCACLIGAITYQGSRSKVTGAICGGTFLGSIFVYQWGAWGRVDSKAILFSLLAILVAQRWENWRGITLATLLCLLSLYTKQTQWATPLAIFIWLLYKRNGRHALGFALLLGGVGGLIFLVLNALTSGQILRHLVLYNTLPYSPRAFLGYWRAFAVAHGVLAGIAVVYVVMSLARRRLSLPVVYFAAVTVLTVAVGRAGASSNYFLELVAASLILCGLLWGELSQRAGYSSAVLPVALVVQLLWFWAFPHSPLRAYYDPLPSFGYTPQASDAQSCEEIDRHVVEAGGEILTEGGGFALRNGKELFGSPWLLSALEPTGLVDEGLLRLEEALGQRRFSLVILTWQSYPPRILDAVWANYERVDTVDCVFRYEIFVPRESA
ncbi:MAG TPA: hypothetical protein VM075_01895 [Anaerolineae bacterium]|nr:hypothetical protein [Anaerolineae bacterium]